MAMFFLKFLMEAIRLMRTSSGSASIVMGSKLTPLVSVYCTVWSMFGLTSNFFFLGKKSSAMILMQSRYCFHMSVYWLM